MSEKSGKKSWPYYGWLGIILLVIFWILNWTLSGVRTHWLFFPLWLGYCLTVDAWVAKRKGHSMLLRNSRAWLGLFLISIPVWWLFELLNLRAQNWFYDGREHFSDLQYAFIASINFSTVIPAVFGTAELTGSFAWLRNMPNKTCFSLTSKKVIIIFSAGWLMLALLLIWPQYFFVFMWLSVSFIVEPINVWLGNRSLLNTLSKGNWKTVLALWTGVLICGFFWEMWNYYSYPKWLYSVPYVNFAPIFEMPLIGYLGYLPFSLELYVIYHLISGLWNKNSRKEFIQI